MAGGLRGDRGGELRITGPDAGEDAPHRRRAERRSRIVRGAWAACLLLAGLNHARILLQHGLSWDYGGVGRASVAYWSALTVIDPIAAALLFARPRAGILVSAALIVTNVLHNLAVTARYTPEGAFLARAAASPAIVSQIGFMLFVGFTARAAWTGTRRVATVSPRAGRSRGPSGSLP